MCNRDRADDCIRKANRAYADGDFSKAEQCLLDASKFKSFSPESRATVYDNLAALACAQGRFSSAVYWYQKVLAIKSHQYPMGSAELKNTIENYRLLVSMCRNTSCIRRVKLTA